MLADAVSSVLKQSQKSLEVIVVDDCSTDGTEEYVKSINDSRVKYIRNDKNSGQGISRREGFRNARGKYVSFLDDDDYYTDYDFYAKAVKILDEHENDDVPVVMVCANAKALTVSTGEAHDSNIGRPGRVKGVDYIIKPEYSKPPSTFPAVFRVDALKRAGLEDMMIFDTMTYIQAALEGDAYFIPDVIGIYRIHGGNMTITSHKKNPEREERHYRIVREGIKRRKKVAERLRSITSRRVADSWYISGTFFVMGYYTIARPGIKDRLKTLRIVLSESGFMPKLWLSVFLKLCSKFLISLPRKIYRRIRGRNKN